ncbi:MAG: type II toxin-antitoxin system ParD family antitoxin [Ahrensia sp.]|nr:type II toxin-antitoxin system ParD family antitoxin [Ahrensia sp.]
MTVKTAISMTDRHHEFAKRKVAEGSYASVSSFIAANIEQAIRDEEERNAALEAMKETIRERMELPRDQWIPWDEDNPIERIVARLEAKRD